jgi:hypothetical protein
LHVFHVHVRVNAFFFFSRSAEDLAGWVEDKLNELAHAEQNDDASTAAAAAAAATDEAATAVVTATTPPKAAGVAAQQRTQPYKFSVLNKHAFDLLVSQELQRLAAKEQQQMQQQQQQQTHEQMSTSSLAFLLKQASATRVEDPHDINLFLSISIREAVEGKHECACMHMHMPQLPPTAACLFASPACDPPFLFFGA